MRFSDYPCFNPRPPRKVGATTLLNRSDSLITFQSSPTPKGGRYLKSAEPLLAVPIICFNPRPPRKVGATTRTGALTIKFQSSPTKGGRYPKGVNRSFTKFQSSPTPKGGRYVAFHFISALQWYPCFNPRPPRKVGATPFMNMTGLPVIYGVSILAHPERWALLT